MSDELPKPPPGITLMGVDEYLNRKRPREPVDVAVEPILERASVKVARVWLEEWHRQPDNAMKRSSLVHAAWIAPILEALIPAAERAIHSETEQTSPNGLWVVWYEDPAKQHEIFFGEGAEAAARARYKSAYDHWSCHLLRRVPHGK